MPRYINVTTNINKVYFMTVATTKQKKADTTTIRIDEEARENLSYINSAGFNASKVMRKFLAQFVAEHKKAFPNK